MGNLFRMNLRDTGITQDTHHNILQPASQEVIDLTTGSLVNISGLAGLLIVDTDDMMGNYDNDMD